MRKTDLKCTEPELWGALPASNAPDDIIEKYLEHVDNCPFHAAIEQDETEAVQLMVEAARSLSESGQLPLPADEEAVVVDNLERYIDFRKGEKRIKSVLLRGTGMEDKLLDLSQRRDQIRFNVPTPCSIQVLTPPDDSGKELLIATHVINATPHGNAGPVRSQLNLPGNRSLSFETRPLAGNWCQVAVTAGKLHKVSLADRLRFGPLASLLRKPMPLAITAVVAFIAIGLIAAWYYQREATAPITQIQTQPTNKPEEEQDNNKQPVNDSGNESASQVEVAINDGGGTVVGLDKNGNLYGLPSGLPLAYRRSVENVLRTSAVPVAPLPPGLKQVDDGRMGTGRKADEFSLISPVQKIVLTQTPRFDWSDLPGAATYNVKVFDDKYRFVVESGPVETSAWAVPPGKALESGKVYIWKVTAVKDGEEISASRPGAAGAETGLSQARFKVLERAKALEIERAKAAYGNSRLLMGTLYAQAGLLDEAEKEFQALVSANPRSKIARKLLADLRARRY